MKKLYLLIACMGAMVSAMAQVSGGPDGFGYTWQNNASTAPDAPAYNWIDITSIGTPVSGLGDDNFVGPLPMGINFRYYWSDYSQLYVGSNGYVGFQSLNISSTTIGFPTMPTVDANNNFVAPMLTDLSFAGSLNPGQVYIWSNNVDTCIVSYIAVPFWINNTVQYGGSNTFQVIFSAADSSVTFQYQQQLGSYDAAYNTVTNPVVVGIENLTGSVGLTVSNNSLPSGNTAVKFYYPDSVLLSVPDVAPTWVQNTSNGGFFVSQNGTAVTGQARIANVGNADVTTAINAQLNITNALGAVVHTDAVSLTGLNTGQDTVVDYSAGYAPTTAGHYTYQVSTTNSSDINATNDLTPVEMVVVDTSALISTLTYWGGTAGSSTNTVSWSGGGSDDGIGIYYEPPFYPATITEVDVYLFTTGAAVGANSFEVRIYDDDGAPGQGTLLGSAFMPAATAASDAFNVVTLPAPVEITSGGFYVGWYMTGQNVQLGLENIAPIARRSYEILFDTWAPYRELTNSEPMIRVKVKRPCTVASGVDLGADTTICSNAPLTLTAGLPSLSYLWSTGDTVNSITVSTPGTYYVDVSDGQGCTGVDTVVIDTITGPDLVLPADIIACDGDTAILDAGAGFDAYFWSTGDTTRTIFASSTGIYSCTVFFANGCSDTDDIGLLIQPAPALNFGPDQVICSGENLAAQGPMGLAAYLWSTGETSRDIVISAPGTYWLQITDNQGCTAADTFEVTLDEPMPDLGADQTICEGDMATLNAGSYAAYLWSNNATTQTIAVSDSGTYSVLVINSNGCEGRDSVQVFVDPVPTASFTASTIDGFTFQFSNTTQNGLDYEWDFGDGSPATTDENPTYTFLFAGSYTITLVANNDCGSDTTEVVIGNVSLDASLESGISIYPNPASEEVKIEFDIHVNKPVSINLYHVTGQRISVETFPAVQTGFVHRIEVAELPEGVYWLEVRTEEGRFAHKLLLQR